MQRELEDLYTREKGGAFLIVKAQVLKGQLREVFGERASTLGVREFVENNQHF